MTKLQKLIGGSVFSLLLLSLTMFSMCSTRMQKLNTDGDIDDLALFDETEEGFESEDDLLSKLELLDSEGGEDAFTADGEGDFDFLSDAADLGDDQSANGGSIDGDDTFVTPELIANMQAEVKDLEEVLNKKDRTAEDLRNQIRSQTNFSDVALAGAEQSSDFPPAVEAPTARPSYLDTEAGMLYKAALDEYYGRRYKNAIRQFRDLLLRGDAGDLADNCHYWIGESYYAQGKYLMATIEFEKVNRFAKGNKLPDARLMVGLALMKAGKSGQASTEFGSVVDFHSNNNVARKAQRYLSSLGV